MANSQRPFPSLDRWAFLALTWELLGNSPTMRGLLTMEDRDLMEACRSKFNDYRNVTLKRPRASCSPLIEAKYSRSTLATWNSLASGEKCDQEQLEIAIKEWRASAAIIVPDLPEAQALLGNSGSYPQDVNKRKRTAGSENAKERPEKCARAGIEKNASGDGSHKQPDVQTKAIRTLITPTTIASIEPFAVSIAEDRTKNLGFASIQTVASIEPSEYPEPEVQPTGQNMAQEFQSSDEPEGIEGDLDTPDLSIVTNMSPTGTQTHASQRASVSEMEELRSEFVRRFAQLRKSQHKMLKQISKGVSKGISKQAKKSMRADQKKKTKKLAKKLAKLEKRVGKLQS